MRIALTIFVGLHPTYACLCLRGGCVGPQAAANLENALRAACQTRGIGEVWLDCQHLTHFDSLAQQALLRAHQHLDLTGVPLYVCGLPAALREQLGLSPLAASLHLRPAHAFRGPQPVVMHR